MFNFCDATSFEELKYMTERAKGKYQNHLKTENIPIVAIGHPKTFGNEKEFEKYLRWATNKEYLEFSTYRFR